MSQDKYLTTINMFYLNLIFVILRMFYTYTQPLRIAIWDVIYAFCVSYCDNQSHYLNHNDVFSFCLLHAFALCVYFLFRTRLNCYQKYFSASCVFVFSPLSTTTCKY